MPFWSPPTTDATRPRPRLLAENGMTGIERGPQPHIIASPPGTGAPIDRINYTPDTGEVHPPGVLAPIDKLNYSLVPHDGLNYNGQLGQPSSPSPMGGPPAQGGGGVGDMLSSSTQPQGTTQSNVWKNTGDPGLMGTGADSITNSPGTPAGVDGLTGRYSETPSLHTNMFSPGQPPLSPTPYGTGPGPRVLASGPVARPFDQRSSSTGNLGNWGQGSGMGMGADDDGDGYDDNTGEPVDDSPEASIYGGGGGTSGSQGGTQPSGSSSVVTPDTGGGGGAPEQAPTSSPPGYHMELRPPNERDASGKRVRQDIWQVSNDPSRPSFPVGWYDSQVKAGSTERPYHAYTEKEQRSMSPEYAKELDAAAKGQSASGNHITEVVGKDGNKHRVMVDKDGQMVNDLGVSELAKPVTGQGDRKVLGGTSLHPQVIVKDANGNYVVDEEASAQMANDNVQKQKDKDAQSELDRQQRLASSQSKPFTVYNDQSGQSWLVNTQTGDKEKLGTVDPKSGIYESNGRLVKIGEDGTPQEIYKPPPGYDIHYDTYGQAIAVNKDDPSKSSVVYTPSDYDERKQLDKQKTLLDIEKAKSGLLTDKAAQVKSRVDLLNTLQTLENPKPQFIGTSDIYFGPGTQADVQRYNPDTKTSTYEHVSGGPRSAGMDASIARIHSMLDELDKAFAAGDTNKASQISSQLQQEKQGQQQGRQGGGEQPGIVDLGPAGSSWLPGVPGSDPQLSGQMQPPQTRTTPSGDFAHYDENGNLTGIEYVNTAPPNYGEAGYPGSEGYDEAVGSTLQGGLEDQGQAEETPWGQEPEQPEDQGYQDQAQQEAETYWNARRRNYMGMGTDIPQGGQGGSPERKPAGRPGYPTEPTPDFAPVPGPGAAPSPQPPGPGAPGQMPPGPQDPTAIAGQPGFNPLKPPDLAALGPPGGGGGAMGAQPTGGAPSGLPGLDDPIFQFAMQRRQNLQGGGAPPPPMGGGQDEPAQPNGQSYAGWTPPVPQDDVAGIGHRFGQPMNVGEPFHSGVDLQAVEGTPTISPVDGVVQRVEYNPQGLGITVVLQGKDGTTHKLGHLKQTDAYPGLVVSQGQDLQSQVGSTGNTTGSHLHWAVKTPDGQPTDPTASLGAMANLPPVPGTQMMGPPGGTSSPGGPGGRGGLPPVAAAAPGGLAVPAQGAPPPPTQQAQPAPGGAGPTPPGTGQDMGAGQTVSREDILNSKPWDPVYFTNPRASRIMLGKRGGVPGDDPRGMPPWEEMDLPFQPGALGTGQEGAGADDRISNSLGNAGMPDEPEDDPLSPFSLTNKNPFGFNDRNLMRLWNEQHKRFVDAQMKKQGAWRTGSQNAPDTDTPEEKANAEWDPEDQPRVFNPSEGMPGRGGTGRRPAGQEIGGRYQRSEEVQAPTAAQQRGWNPQPNDYKDNPYSLEARNPHDQKTNPREWRKWQNQHNWFLRKEGGTTGGDVTDPNLQARLDRLVNQGWPQAAIDELKALGHPPTRDEAEAVRAKYKSGGALNAPDTPAEAEAAGKPGVIEQMGPGAQRLRASAQARGPLDPNAPDYVPGEISEGGVLDQMGPGARRLDDASVARRFPDEGEGEETQTPPAPAAPEMTLDEAHRILAEQHGKSYSEMSRDEVELGNQAARIVAQQQEPKPGWEPPVDTLGLEENGGLNPGEPKVDPEEEQYQQALREIQRKYPGADDDLPGFGGSKGVSTSVSPPIDLGGGHKPPVGPDIRDIIGKPAINVLPGPMPGGHIPVPLPSPPKGHVPGPEIKLPNITDVPHPDIKLPDWLPGQSQPQPQPPADTGTAEDYSTLLDRLRQLGQGAGADDGDDEQIAQALGIPPEQITDEIRQWWASRPQPQPVQPDASGEEGMGAGLQLGPIHLSTSMRQPVRMPSSRVEMGRRAGWTPRTGGMKRRSSMGTSAMLNV